MSKKLNKEKFGSQSDNFLGTITSGAALYIEKTYGLRLDGSKDLIWNFAFNTPFLLSFILNPVGGYITKPVDAPVPTVYNIVQTNTSGSKITINGSGDQQVFYKCE
jgi:hypothetical protein